MHREAERAALQRALKFFETKLPAYYPDIILMSSNWRIMVRAIGKLHRYNWNIS